METIRYPLNKIYPNPWNARGQESSDHVKRIALSIAREGMFQTPLGRPSPDRPDTIQLAFGHTRLAAYRLLHETRYRMQPGANAEAPDEELAAALDEGEDYGLMPVLVTYMSDEDMYRRGIDENLARKDLSPIEEARAMLRYRDEFGKTSAEIGELFGLAESSVRNKMRLAGLPLELQTALGEGRLSEGAGRELLRFFDLPEDVQKEGGNEFQMPNEYWQNRKSIVARAMEGATADQVRETINRLIRSQGNNLHEAKWKWDEVYDLALDPALLCETCKACDYKMELERKIYCSQSRCYGAKRKIWIKRRLAQASAVCGIRAPDDPENVGHIQVEDAVRKSGCANLRVVYSTSMITSEEKKMLVPGFDDVAIMCGNRNSICTCANGLVARKVAEEKRRKFEDAQAAVARIEGKEKPQIPQIDAEKKENNVTSADELRQAARDEKKAQQRERDELNRLRAEFAGKVRDAALSWNKFAWYLLLNKSTYNLMHHPEVIGPIEQSLEEAGLEIASKETAYWNKIELDRRRKELNDVLAKLGLSPLEEEMVLGYREQDGTETVERVVRIPVEEELHSLPGQLPGETLMAYYTRTDPGFEAGEDAELREL